ncbi:MAG: hypothetical protein Fur0037_21690 [Planctomycetota bacterium]
MTKKLIALLSLCACAAGPTALPDEEGRGLVAYDPSPPKGAELFERPTWRVGDRVVLLRGGRQRLEQVVVAATGSGYELADQTGSRMFRDLDLATLGESPGEGLPLTHRLAPKDVRYHWPLWVGKRWKCHYLDQSARGSMPFVVGYAVEAVDEISVPAGTFRCLRIVRTSERATEDGADWFQGTMVIWYAPDIGIEVRQVIGGLSIDLIEWQASGGAPAARRDRRSPAAAEAAGSETARAHSQGFLRAKSP